MTPCVLLMFRFRPRVLVDVSKIDTSTRILGYPISSPIMIAPIAMHMLAHPEGETATAKAAAACKYYHGTKLFIGLHVLHSV